MDPIEFAEARLAEDRSVAQSARLLSDEDWQELVDRATRPPLPEGRRRRLGNERYKFLRDGREAYDYLNRYHSWRAYREVEAGQRVLDRHRECGTGAGYCDQGGHGLDGPVGCADMADLLARWADHRDYDLAWKPAEA